MASIRWLAVGVFASVLLGGAARSEKHPVPETVADGAKLVEVYRGVSFFEGPTWNPQEKALYFAAFDTKHEQILRLDAPGKATVWLDRSRGVNGTCLTLDGRLLGAEALGHRIVCFELGTEKAGAPKVLYENPALNQPNDLCQAPNGDIYFTDPDFKRHKSSAVYLLKPDGKTTKILMDIDEPNGVEVSPDGKTLYVSDSFRKLWRAYPIGGDGTVGSGKFFLNPRTDNMAEPDGMTLDERGNLYGTGRGGVWVVSPTAKVLGLIAVPEFCSNVTFGGEDGTMLYLTCKKKVYVLRMKVRGARYWQAP